MTYDDNSPAAIKARDLFEYSRRGLASGIPDLEERIAEIPDEELRDVLAEILSEVWFRELMRVAGVGRDARSEQRPQRSEGEERASKD